MIVGYVSASTVEQNEDRQIATMNKYEVEKVFSENVSPKNGNREQLNFMLDFVREGDTVVIYDFSRLARNTKSLLEIVELLESKKVTLISEKENVDTSTVTGKLMLTMIREINEFERINMLERQKEGISEAKKKGKYKVLKEVKNDNFEEYCNRYMNKEVRIDNFEEYCSRYMNREVNKTQLAKELGVSRSTLDKLILAYIENNQG